MKHKLSRLIALMLAVVMTFSMLLIPVEAASFRDVSDNAWYKAAVDYVHERGWMAGVSDSSFAPATEVTRGMFVTVLARYAKAGTDNANAAFADTSAGKWYTGAAAWAAEQGIVSGVGNNCFAPNRSITRQDLAAILYQFVLKQEYQIEANADRTFADMDTVADYARTAVGFCAASGLMVGDTNSNFNPKATATRAELAQILMKLDTLVLADENPVEPMPAQSFDGEAGEDMTVTVIAPEGALPEDTDMTVSRVTDEAALASIREKINGEVFAAADISFTKNGAELEPETEVEVQIKLDGIENVQNPMIAHIKDDGNVEYVSAEMVSMNRGSSEKVLRFYAKDFSVYAVVDPIGAGFTVTVNFYVRTFQNPGPSSQLPDPEVTTDETGKEWKLISKQMVRSNQIQKANAALADEDPSNDNDGTLIHDPGVPDLKDDQAFEGWNTNRAFTEADTGITVENINATVRGLTAETELNFFSMVYNVIYVVYHDQAGAVIRTQYEHIDDATEKAAVTMDGYTPFKGEQNCTGWVLKSAVQTFGDHPTYVNNPSPIYLKGTEYEIDEVLELYPYVQEGYWLSFNNNIAGNNTANGFTDWSAAEYISPVFYAKGVNTVAPSFPTNNPRPGYTFAGWYTDPAMRNAYSFGAPITKDTTLYAKWTPATTTYSVVFWKQKSTDAVDAADADKTYDYDSYRIQTNATTGSTATLSTADQRKGNYSGTTSGSYGFYYTYNSNKSQDGLMVKGDGSTVLNVYYDRKTITYNFKMDVVSGYSSSNSGYYSSYYHHYGVNSSNNLIQIYTNASTYSDGDYQSPTWYTNAACTNRYSGTVYHAVFNSVYSSSDYPPYASTAGTITLGSISGLYEASMENYLYDGGSVITGSDWPNSGKYYVWVNAKDCRYVDKIYQYTVGTYTTTTEFDYYYSQYKVETTRPYTCLGMDTNGQYTITLDDAGLTSTETVYFAGDEYYGYTCYKYNKTSNNLSSASSFTGAEFSISYSDIGSSGHAYIWYNREQYPLNFFSGSTPLTDLNATVYYDKSLSSYEPAAAPTAPEGTYFVGWYADPTLETPFDFSQKMPRAGVSVYAKFNPKWYRIVVDYKRGDSSVVVTVPGTTQKASFTVQYGTQTQTSALLSAKREGYILLGLYTDPACEHLFNENMQAPFGLVSEAQEIYPDSQRTGVDDLTGETWSDVGYPDIRAKITLYAKWRKDPNGAIGLNLTYLGDNDPDTGYFNTLGRPHVWDDPETYVDLADAYSQPASVPETPGEQFLHWEVLTPDLDENGNYQYNDDGSVKMKPSGEITYPGQTFQPQIDNAVEVRTRIPDPNCQHTQRTQHEAVAATCTENGYQEYWQCDACGKIFATQTSTEEFTDYLIPALGHDWETPTYTWDKSSTPYKCTATAYCSRTPNAPRHRLQETVTAELVNYDPPAVNKEGHAHYVATFTNKPTFEDQTDTDVFTVPALTGYEITFSVPSGVMAPATQVKQDGENVDLSVVPTGSVNGWTFVGWVAGAINNETSTATEPLETYTVHGNATLYALYTRSVAHGGTYTRVTSTQSNWSGNYVITYGRDSSLYALKGQTGTKNYEDYSYAGSMALANTGMTLSSNTLRNVPERYVFTFEKDGSYYSIKNLETGSYLSRYASSTTALLRSYASYNSTYGQWTPAYSSGHVTLTNNYSSSLYTGYTMLGFQTSKYYFWVNTSGESDTENIYLWKETTAPGETAYYITNASAITAYDVSFSVPEGVTAPATQTVSAGGSIVLPDAGDPDSTHRFLGWSTVTVDDSPTRPTSWLSAGALYTPSADITLVALYMSYDEYYVLLTTMPSNMAGTYVISSGTTDSAYMMTSITSGNYQSSSRKTLISTSTAHVDTLNGNTILRDVPNANRYTIIGFTSTSTLYGKYVLQNNDGYFVCVNSNNYLAIDGTSYSSNIDAWSISCTSGKFAFNNVGRSSYYLNYNSSSNYFCANTSSTPTVYLWKRTTDEHYATLSDGASGGSTTTQYTVTYHTNGTVTTQTVDEGTQVTLPTPSGVGNASFVGWVTSEISGTVTDQPTLVSSPYTVNANAELYALYTYSTAGTTETVYNLLTATPSDWSGYYVISYGKDDSMYVLKGLSSDSVTYETTSGCATLTAAGITRDGTTLRNVNNIYVFEAGIATDYENYPCFMNVSTGGYLSMYKSGSSADTQLYNYTSLYTTGLWQLTYSTSNQNVTLLNYYYGVANTDTYPYFAFSTTNSYFWTGSENGGTTNSIYLWKQNTVTSGSVTYYTTNASNAPSGSVHEPLTAIDVDAASEDVLVEAKLTGALDIQALGLPETKLEQPAAEETKAAVTETEAAETEAAETETVETLETETVEEALRNEPTRQGDIAQTASAAPAEQLNSVTPVNPVGATVSYWEPVDTITNGETYLIGYHRVDTTHNVDKVYLLMSYNPAASAYYTSASLSGYTCTKVCYAIPAVLDSDGNVTGVDTTNFSGATLQHVQWKFDLVDTDTLGARYSIQSVYDDGMFLRIEDDLTSADTDLQLYPATSVQTYYKNYWRWDSSNHYLSHYYSSSYLQKYLSVLTSTSTGEVTCFEADSDSTYAKTIILYKLVEEATYTLTVRCKDANGNVLATKTFQNIPAGSYSINANDIAVAGYHMTSPASALNITMPASDYTVDIVFAPDVVSNERWEPVDTITPGEEYLIAYVVNGTPYLLLNHSDVNNSDYYTITSGSDTYNLGYLGQATTVTENGKTYVSGVSGATTDLSNCHWEFVSVTGGYNIVVPEDHSTGLYWGGSTSGIAGVVPSNSLDTWVWTATNTTNHYGTMKNSWTSTGGTTYTMYFYPRTSDGTASTTANPPYAGVSSSSFAYIRLYQKAKELSTWTVTFIDEDGNPIEGYPDQQVANGNTIQAPAAIQDEDYYFLGWFDEEGNPFDFTQPITEDTTVIAHMLYAWEVKYTVYLRAVYGMINTDGLTHIYWYTNDGTDHGVGEGAGYRHETLGLRINDATDIPTPSSYTYVDESGTTQTGLYRAGYTFLGWAREETVGAGNMGVDKTDLTESSLYLHWNSSRNCYEYNAGTAAEPNWTQLSGGSLSQGQVYADESRPYHDMYAIWVPAYYYVFHSSDGKLEQRSLTFNTGSYTSESLIQPVDLTAAIPDGYLYGGYYKTYGGVDMNAVNAKIKALETGNNTGWTNGVYQTNFANEAFVAYTGATAKNGTKNFWTRADAYQLTGSMSSTQIANIKAETMRPVAGNVYYLKEVPDDYLANQFWYVYDNLTNELGADGQPLKDDQGNYIKTKLLQNLYFLSVVDDTLYKTIGYKIIDLVNENPGDDSMAETLFEGITKRTSLARSVNFVQQNAGVDENGKPKDVTTTIRPTDFTGIQGGYMVVLRLDNYISSNNAFTVRPTWETLDGVQVSSKTGLGITIGANCKITDDGFTRTDYSGNRLYIDLEDAKFKYTNDGANFTDENWAYNRNDNKTVAYFFNDSGSTWVELSTLNAQTEPYMRYVDVPDGYNKMILVMFGKNDTNYSFSNYWAQTANITIHTNKNCISSFYGYSSDGRVTKPATDNFTVWADYAPDLED